MLDLDKLPIEIACPRCDYPFEIEMIDARLESQIFCPNCKIRIQLHDSEGSLHAGREQIQTALNDFVQAFRKLGK